MTFTEHAVFKENYSCIFVNNTIFIFREEATSALAGLLSRSKWNLEMLGFQEGGKLEHPEKNPWNKTTTKYMNEPKP